MEIAINNITLNYIKEGKGKPVILLHGNGENLHIFDKLFDKLKIDFTVYALDSRNHGLSSRTNDFGYEVMADDLYQFIKVLNIDKPSVVGFSDGAIISLLLAIEQPDIFSKMILLGVNLKPEDFKEENYNYLLEEYNKTKDPFLRLMLEEPHIELESLQQIPVPTLVVAAENDLFKDDLFVKIVNNMPDATLKIMHGHEHDSYVINQDILYPDLKDFINK